MILSDTTILKRIKDKEIVVDPLVKKNVQPSSIDLRIADEYSKLDNKSDYISTTAPNNYRIEHHEIVKIPAKSFILARTMEYIEIPDDVIAFVEGRSSVGRLGLFIHNAGVIDPGFKGTITLELFNAQDKPIFIKSGTRICQLVFHELDRRCKLAYDGKYQGQIDTTGSRIYLDND